MKCTIEIEMDNDAFQEGNSGRELSRILRGLAKTVDETDWHDLLSDESGFGIQAMDIKGNHVGTLDIE